MNKKNVLAALAIIAVSGGLLAASTFAVLHFVPTPVPELHGDSKRQGIPAMTLANSKIPILKVESPVPVTTVKEYLEQTMTDEDIQQIYHYFDNIKVEAEASNRKMTDQEAKRLKVLKEQYMYEGIRPHKPLPLKEGNYSFYLDLSKAAYVYPKRLLTDEELLQYIDWYSRVDFALNKRIVKPQPDTKDISEADALAKAHDSVTRLFDVDVSKLEVTASYHKFGPGQIGEWVVHFQPYNAERLQASGETYFMYDVFIDSLSGNVIDTTLFNSNYKRTPITAPMKEQIKQDHSWIDAARTIVREKQGEARVITKTSFIEDVKYDQRGVVAISISLEDGNAYIAELRYPEKTLRCLIYEPAPKKK
ncbi:hypothetical protein J23TS9_17310 [Paenibacillus sp. J23TS9]|uniref:hypothetical protein n=1 Tax=Paenibacillus sp. J23TS9 TaxID=2807193 RepID=UPI001B087359|nr:hypothetical protein [Paenibacillus sp. J23TS9]GIP26601.1 hypothetical protein J23TS9_17310 [Paenibacillus sp. J23TS9]